MLRIHKVSVLNLSLEVRYPERFLCIPLKCFVKVLRNYFQKRLRTSLSKCSVIHDANIIIIIIIIIIIFINCNWIVTRWKWLFYMYTNYEIGY